MKKYIILSLVFSIAGIFSLTLIVNALNNNKDRKARFILAEVKKSQSVNSTGSTDDIGYRSMPNDAFGFGELLNYHVNYSFVKAGEGYFQIQSKPAVRNDRKCYDIRFGVQSLKSLEFLYKVKDSYRTLMDVDGLFPWEFEQTIREGKYSRDFKASFDQKNHYAYVDTKKYKVPPYVHDVVSAFYFARSLNLSKMRRDTTFYLENFWDNKSYKLGVRIKGKATVEVDAGTFRCIIIEPLVVQGGLFKSEGQVLIYVTDDDRKIPVKVSTKILIGSVSADLVAYKGLRGPLKSKLD